MKKVVFLAWISLSITLTVLSYTQVDLNLTLLNWPPYLRIQDALIQLGYFNRPLNGWLLVLLFSGLFAGYLTIIKLSYNKVIAVEDLKKIALICSSILLFSYSAFSHDIFNYIFDARIITLYGQNPYEHKALDYPNDDWIRFMHWTHRTYPYGPAWLAITIVPSILGFAKLLPTYLLFKLMFVLSYHIMLRYSLKILDLRKESSTVKAVSFSLLAFNPLILIDGLVSSRIDLVMSATAVISLYYYLLKSPMSLFWAILSGGIKFATLGFVPVYIAGYFYRLKDQTVFQLLFGVCLLAAGGQMLIRATQPWYFMMPLIFLSFMYPRWKLKNILITTFVMFVPMLSTYLYFFFAGQANPLWFINL